MASPAPTCPVSNQSREKDDLMICWQSTPPEKPDRDQNHLSPSE